MKLITIFLISFNSLALPPIPRPSRGENPLVEKVVLDGQRVDDSSWPYNLAVKLQYETSHGLAICSGILIGPSRVLTAGHCMMGNEKAEFTVYGSTQITSGKAIGSVYEGDDDLGIVELAKPLIKADSDFLPFSSGNCDTNSGYEVIGFGLDGSGNDTQTPNAAIYESDMKNIENETMVLNVRKNSKARACVGDSGAPVICKENGKQVIAGVVSKGVAQSTIEAIIKFLPLVPEHTKCSWNSGIRITRVRKNVGWLSDWVRNHSDKLEDQPTPTKESNVQR